MRLELNVADSDAQNLLFQFHKGAIRTDDADKHDIQIQHFNSIKVRLERRSDTGKGRKWYYFNSIKVRLEHISALSFGLVVMSISIP